MQDNSNNNREKRHKHLNRRAVVQKENVTDEQAKTIVWSELWDGLKIKCLEVFGKEEVYIKTKFEDDNE